MPFRPFHDLFPEIAQAETRCIFIREPGSDKTPAGRQPQVLPISDYALMELYCDEPGCDCRRVFFQVLSDEGRVAEAVIAFGWESREFYRRWLSSSDLGMIDELIGPALNFGSPQSENAPELLDLVSEVLKRDPAYVERLKRHYAMFRRRIEGSLPGDVDLDDGDNLDDVIAELDNAHDYLPEDAIRRARRDRDQIVPLLIDTLVDAAAEAREGSCPDRTDCDKCRQCSEVPVEPDGNAHFFALYLLTEFHATEALPAVLAAVSLPGELPVDLFGDAITESLPAILAELARDQFDTIHELIDDRSINEDVRSAAAQTFIYLVREGRLDRDEAVERLRTHLRLGIERKDEEIVGSLICVLDGFSPKEARKEIAEAYDLDLIDEFVIELEDIDKSIALGQERMRAELEDCPPTGIPDTIEELKTWSAYRGEQPDRATPPLPRHSEDGDPSWEEPLDDSPVWEDANGNEFTPRRTPKLESTHQHRRNDPCPCGSGRKFKRCCLNAAR